MEEVFGREASDEKLETILLEFFEGLCVILSPFAELFILPP
jgi:hypothetical protein